MPEKFSQSIESEDRNIEKLKTGAAVRFTMALADKPLPAVLVVHGWGSQIFKLGGIYEKVVKSLNNEKYHCLSLSLRGHQYSEGEIDKVTRREHTEDIKAAFKYLTKRSEVDSARVGAFGTSYGGYLVSTLSSEFPLRQLVLRAPNLYPDTGWEVPTKTIIDDKKVLTPWCNRSHSPEDNRALAGLAGFKGDLLMISSGKDDMVPYPVTESYTHAIGETHSTKYVVLPEAKHSLDQLDREDFVKVFTEWFQEHYPQF